ncbi:MAG TPA: SRPBCC domain-containing protein [Anaerolineales bacterium]|nr:SRPBCC domain-containing protein [Anaerolineales bacterium]
MTGSTGLAPKRSIELRRTYPATLERVFSAWTQPELLKEWWGVADGYTTPLVEIDLKIGGRYRFGMLPPGQDDLIVISGEYRAIEPPERLVFTWAIESETGSGEASTITLRFLDRGASTELVLKHEYAGPAALSDEFRAGWEGMLARLRARIGSPGEI